MKLKITVLGVDYEVDVEVLEEDGVAYPNSVPAMNYTHRTLLAPVSPAEGPNAAPAAKFTGSGIIAPVSGTVVEVSSKPGDKVKRGQTLLVMEAMKMETKIASDRDGTIKSIHVKAGENIREGQLLVEFV